MSKYPDTIDKITKARLAFSKFNSVLSIALTMFFIGVLTFFVYLSSNLLDAISNDFEMEVLFHSQEAGVSEADIITYEKALKREEFVKTSRVSSCQKNTEEARKAVGCHYDEVIANPINASIILTLKPGYTSKESLQQIKRKISANKIVRDVDYPQEIVRNIQNNLQQMQLFSVICCAIFMFISLMLIANFIRLNIYAKRFSIRTLLLIGATRSFARKPFVLKGLSQGTWGGALAVLLLCGALYGLQKSFSLDLALFFPKATVISILVGIFLFSVLFTTLFSCLFANKYIKINSDSLYL